MPKPHLRIELRPVRETGLSISAIGLGSWPFGRQYWNDVSDKSSIHVIHAALEAGINWIDTAPFYGDGYSESLIGKTIAPLRNKVILATKFGLQKTANGIIHDLRPATILRELEQSTKRLQTDYLDIYLAHWPDPNIPLETTLTTLIKLKKEGRIRAIGLCNHPIESLRPFVSEIDVLQYQYSLIETKIEQDILPFATQNGIGVLAYGVLHGGLLTGKYETQPHVGKKEAKQFFYHLNEKETWDKAQAVLEPFRKNIQKTGITMAGEIIQKTYNTPGIISAIVGMKTIKQLKENLG